MTRWSLFMTRVASSYGLGEARVLPLTCNLCNCGYGWAAGQMKWCRNVSFTVSSIYSAHNGLMIDCVVAVVRWRSTPRPLIWPPSLAVSSCPPPCYRWRVSAALSRLPKNRSTHRTHSHTHRELLICPWYEHKTGSAGLPRKPAGEQHTPAAVSQ